MDGMTDPCWINVGHRLGEPYRCEEANLFIQSTEKLFVPCSRPAPQLLYSKRDKQSYHMCNSCAEHNFKRGMVSMISPRETILSLMLIQTELLNMEEPNDR